MVNCFHHKRCYRRYVRIFYWNFIQQQNGTNILVFQPHIQLSQETAFFNQEIELHVHAGTKFVTFTFATNLFYIFCLYAYGNTWLQMATKQICVLRYGQPHMPCMERFKEINHYWCIRMGMRKRGKYILTINSYCIIIFLQREQTTTHNANTTKKPQQKNL